MKIKKVKSLPLAFLLVVLLGLLFTWTQKPPPIAAGSQAADNLCFNGFLPFVIGGNGEINEGNGGEPADVPHSYESCAGFPDFNGDGYADLAIGVPYEDVTTQEMDYQDAGAVNVIYGTANGLVAQAQNALVDDQIWSRRVAGLDEIALGIQDKFGAALATGDFNDDGYDDLAIGVPNSVVGEEEEAGAVHVLYGSADGLTAENSQTWTQESFAVADTAQAGDHYGGALTAGDFDDDGYDDLAIGIPDETVNGDSNAGAINILYGTDHGLDSRFVGWAQDDFLTQDTVAFFATADPNDRFGHTLATGDFNDDGIDDLAVGVPYEDNGPGFAEAGAVQIFFGSAASGIVDPSDDALYPQHITANTSGVDNAMEASELFGYTLAAADFNRDGFDDLAIGTPYETHGSGDDKLSYAGAVNIVFGAASGLNPEAGAPIWHQNSTGMESEAASFEYFGWRLEAADFNNDGYADLAVGVPQDTVLGVPIGAVHILYSDDTGPTADNDQLIYDPGNPAASDGFGFAVTAIDANGDSYIDLVVGTNEDDPVDLEVENVGSVFVFHSNGDGVSQTDNQNWYQGHNGLAGAPEASDRFGSQLP